MIKVFTGFWFGLIAGVIIMCLMQINRGEDYDEQ